VISQQDAGYQAHPDTVVRRCCVCSMFRLPGSCTLVSGYISPLAVCERFQLVLIGRP
jgi:hypothetical protein